MLSGGSNIRSVALIKMMVKNVEMNIQQSSAQSATPAADILMTFSIQLRLSGFIEDSLLSLWYWRSCCNLPYQCFDVWKLNIFLEAYKCLKFYRKMALDRQFSFIYHSMFITFWWFKKSDSCCFTCRNLVWSLKFWNKIFLQFINTKIFV